MHGIATNYNVRALDDSAKGLCFQKVGLQTSNKPFPKQQPVVIQ